MIEIETLVVIKPIRLISKTYFRNCRIKDVEVVYEDIGKQQNGQIWEYTLPKKGHVEKIIIDAANKKNISVIYKREVFHSKKDFEQRINGFGCEWKINEV